MNDNPSRPIVSPSNPLAEPITEPITNLSPDYTRVVEAGEDGYRCGYYHGFHAALETLGLYLPPAALEQVWAFLDHELSPWRNYAAEGSRPPPILKLVCIKPPVANQEKQQATRQAVAGPSAPRHPPAAVPVPALEIAPTLPPLSSQRNPSKDGDPWSMVSKIRKG